MQAATVVAAMSIIAAENRVECGRNVVALDLKPANEKAFTALGNIAGGPILINGGALGAPLAAAQHHRSLTNQGSTIPEDTDEHRRTKR